MGTSKVRHAAQPFRHGFITDRRDAIFASDPVLPEQVGNPELVFDLDELDLAQLMRQCRTSFKLSPSFFLGLLPALRDRHDKSFAPGPDVIAHMNDDAWLVAWWIGRVADGVGDAHNVHPEF